MWKRIAVVALPLFWTLAAQTVTRTTEQLPDPALPRAQLCLVGSQSCSVLFPEPAYRCKLSDPRCPAEGKFERLNR